MMMFAKMAAMLAGRAATVAPPSFVSSSSNDRGSGTPAISVTAPTGIADGDVLYAIVFSGFSAAAAATITGFSQIAFDNSAAPTITVLKKTAASESGAYSVAETTAGVASAAILVYRGGLGTEDVVGTISRISSGTATNAAPSLTALTRGILLAFFGKAVGSNTVTTPPSGMTLRASKFTNYNLVVYDLSQSAGATGSETVVWTNATGAGGAQLLQIK